MSTATKTMAGAANNHLRWSLAHCAHPGVGRASVGVVTEVAVMLGLRRVDVGAG